MAAKDTNAEQLIGSKRLRRLVYSRANKQTARLDRRGIVPSWLFSSCLISALTLSEDPGNRENTEVFAK